MGLYLTTSIIDSTKDLDDIIKDIEILFDNDHNGQNGIEFCWVATVNNNCNSNIEYLVKKNLEDEDLDDVNFESLIENVIEELFDKDSWYNAYEYNITELENGKLFVSLACESSYFKK